MFEGSVPADFATDAEAALAFLRARDDIDPERTGIIGHSEGGVTGPMVAARDPDLAFLVMMAGPGVTGLDLLVEQGVEIVRTMGAPEAVLTQQRFMRRSLLEAVVNAPDEEAAKAVAKERLRVLMALQGMDAEAAEQQAGQQAEQLGSTYMRALLGYDPAPLLTQITTPVLAINGSKDTQVPAWQNLPALRELFADHPDATIVELEGLNHLFQTAGTGGPGEYAEIEETFAPVALETILGWIAERVLED
jgi:pimeloyl-ACP methyl ester carboxylesterase